MNTILIEGDGQKASKMTSFGSVRGGEKEGRQSKASEDRSS